MSAIQLKGMTWSHPRGHDPMVACSRLYRDETGVDISWDKRSLQDFESYPVEDLARAYDLIVIDHPHVGQITKEHCLAPLDEESRSKPLAEMQAGSVGQSFASYRWQGRQWALPIDAAAQVLAWRPDLIDHPPESWAEMMDLARRGHALIPLRPPHSLMSLFTLAANLGHPARIDGTAPMLDLDTTPAAYAMLAELAALQPRAGFAMDPIAVFELMAEAGSKIALSPLIYGYVSYAMEGFRPHLLAFADIPAAGNSGPVGSALGGTGIAVSAFCKERQAAIDFAFWIAGGKIQRGLYASAGGQPGHAAAWSDEAVNAAAGKFYSNTRKTLESAWLRPRHNGYMHFQQQASERLTAALERREDGRMVIAGINAMFAESFAES